MKIGFGIITYNRPDKLKILLNSVRKEKIDNVYFFLDSPKSNNLLDKEIIKQNLKIIKSYKFFNRKKIFIFNRNQGIKKMWYYALNKIIKKNDFACILEDDCIPKMGFNKYIKFVAEKFKDDNEIFSVSSYCFPFNKEELNNFKCDFFKFSRTSAWGFGIWKNRYNF